MKIKKEILAILVLDGCGASGVSLAERAIYSVPDEVSLRDAELLIRMGKAEAVDIDGVEAAEKEAAEKEAAEKEAAEKEAAAKHGSRK